MLTSYEFASAWLQARCKTDRGASLVEYALLVALIAVVCIVAVTFLGKSASRKFSLGRLLGRRLISFTRLGWSGGGPHGPPPLAVLAEIDPEERAHAYPRRATRVGTTSGSQGDDGAESGGVRPSPRTHRRRLHLGLIYFQQADVERSLVEVSISISTAGS